MVRFRIFSILSIHFLQSSLIAQSFEFTIESEIKTFANCEIVETHPNRWVSNFLSSDENTACFLEIIELNDEIIHEITPISNENCACTSIDIIPQWSDSVVVIGVGNCKDLKNGKTFTANIEFFTAGELNIIAIDTILNYPSVLGGLLFAVVGEPNNDIVHFASIYYRLTDSSTFYLISQYDRDFNQLKTDTLNEDGSEIWSYMTDFTVSADGLNYIVCSAIPVLYSIDIESLELDTFWIQSELNLDTGFHSLAARQIIIKSEFILVSGNLWVDRAPGVTQVNRDDDIFTIKFDLNGNLIAKSLIGTKDTLLSNAVYSHNEDHPGFRSLAINKDGFIYQAGSSKTRGGSSSYIKESNRILIAKMDENLDSVWYLEWSDSLKSRFFNYALFATGDGGALLLSHKFDFNTDSLSDLSIHVLRLKEDGSPYALSVPVTEKEILYSVFPNPSNGEIHINGNLEHLKEIILIGQDGTIIKRFDNLTRTFNISERSAGIYYLLLRNKDESVELKKVVKI